MTFNALENILYHIRTLYIFCFRFSFDTYKSQPTIATPTINNKINVPTDP
jgi:hypothetical protein